MGYTMKRGNGKISYSDILSEPNQMESDAIKQEREADVESQKAEKGMPYVGKIIDVATDALKEDTAHLERAYNNRIAAASIQRK